MSRQLGIVEGQKLGRKLHHFDDALSVALGEVKCLAVGGGAETGLQAGGPWRDSLVANYFRRWETARATFEIQPASGLYRTSPRMPAPASISEVLQFGLFELDMQQAELRKRGVRIKLQEQPLKVLNLLLQNRGEIVTREQLRNNIWPANTFVEFDHGLYSAMARLREALGDSSENPRFIETVARRGYRFIAPVTSPGTIAVSISEPTVTRRPPRSRRLVASVLAGLLAGALLLGVVLGFNLANSRDWLRGRSNPQVRSLAVLPLQNLSGDPTQEYFADGITDELITELAELGSVRVISRTSVMQYKGAQKQSHVSQVEWHDSLKLIENHY